jgi:carboxylesterase type B
MRFQTFLFLSDCLYYNLIYFTLFGLIYDNVHADCMIALCVYPDCLTLNIWAPVSSSTAALRPVMIWIYGGGYIMGASSFPIYEGTRLAATGAGAVIVSLNYRLGALGFLVSQELLDVNPRAVNFGILDQQLALRWVKDNIAVFGGDNQRVTLFGQSCGSFSISLHYILPSSWGLFRRVALESGTVFTNETGPAILPTFSKAIYMKQSTNVLLQLGCSTISCARSVPVSSLLQVIHVCIVCSAGFFFYIARKHVIFSLFTGARVQLDAIKRWLSN